MNTKEVSLIAKSFNTQQKNSTLQVLKHPEVEQKTKSLTYSKKIKRSPKPQQWTKNANEINLQSLDMLTAVQKQKFRAKLKLPTYCF